MTSCSNVITIPQYRGTCWFNSILMSIFYSQHSRKLLYHHFEGKKDKFSKIMNNIIKHIYIKKEKTIEYFKFMKPENILKYINGNTTELYKEFRISKTYSYEIEAFLPFFLKNLNKNVLDIILHNDKYYANFYSILPEFFTNIYKSDGTTLNIDISKFDIKSKDIITPDYILVNKIQSIDKIKKSMSRYKLLFLKAFHIIKKPLNLETHIDGLSDLANEITYNDNTYVLDSILLNNYNYDNIKKSHVISGITCNNERYVYNGWIRITRDPGMSKNNGNRILPCELMRYQWDIKNPNEFCLNPNLCKLDDKARERELCFSFNQIENATLIYVKVDRTTSQEEVIYSSSSLTLPSLKSSDFSEVDSGLIDDDYKKARKQRKINQEEYKRLYITKINLELIKFNSNYYITIDEYLNKENLLSIKNPNQIIIDNLETDALGLGDIKQLEYVLNINNYSADIQLRENKPNLIYNGNNYDLLESTNGINIYELVDESRKIYFKTPIKLKPVRKIFSDTEKELSNFKEKSDNIAYLQELETFLDITKDEIEVKTERTCVVSGGGYNNTYIDCILAVFFSKKNLTIEELFFKKKKPLKNENAIIIRNEFKSYYETKKYDKSKLMKAIQNYYNDYINSPKIQWSRGKYYFTDLIILLQKIFNFNKTKIRIVLSYNEKFKIIEKQETTIKTITITKNPDIKPKIKAIITRIKDKYKYFDNINDYLKEKSKIVSCVYY
uniref:Uncharacterized protein n=1 Tax=viral metagenome TaxID=1070528 RepID=A0A6C0LI02_9ZZZZ